MKKSFDWGWLSILALLVGALTTSCQQRQDGSSERSAKGADPVSQRGNAKSALVSLTPSLTEIAVALDRGADIVGLDNYSKQRFPELAAIKLGDFVSPNFERIVGLSPTLTLLDTVQGNVATALDRAGLKTLSVNMHSIKDVQSAVSEVASHLGDEEKGRQLLAGMSVIVRARGKELPGLGTKVLVIIDRQSSSLANMIAAGPDSYVDELLNILGAENVLADAPTRYPKISADTILARNPELILEILGPGTKEGGVKKGQVADWQVLASVKAVAQGRVLALEQQALRAPSVHLAAALEELAASFSFSN